MNRETDFITFGMSCKIYATHVVGTSSLELWHKRLGHLSDKVVWSPPFINESSSVLEQASDLCHQAKQSRNKFPVSDTRATFCFQIIHCDLWGPYYTPSSCGATYFLTIVHDYSRVVWVYLLFDKTKVYDMFSSFFGMIVRQFGVHVKVVRSDNDTEFNCMKSYFDKNGILFQTSCVDTRNKMAV